jgi:hypothetical protein
MKPLKRERTRSLADGVLLVGIIIMSLVWAIILSLRW